METEQDKPVGRGRPRSSKIQQMILEATVELVLQNGFRALTMDAIAARAGVGKMTVYRRWSNKATLVMDAFLTIVGPSTDFPEAPRALTSIMLQLRLQAAFFQSEFGGIIKSLLGEAQFDSEVADAFRDRWLLPRRQTVRRMLEEAIHQGDIRSDIDLETAIDMLYGPIYYRLLNRSGPIDEAFTDTIFTQVIEGLHETGSASDLH